MDTLTCNSISTSYGKIKSSLSLFNLKNYASSNFSFPHHVAFKKNGHLPIVLLVADGQLNRYTAAVILISKHLNARGFGKLH